MKLHKSLLKNIYFAALHHEKLNELLSRDLLATPEYRAKARGAADAYAYIVQMIHHNDTIGQADYKNIHKMTENFPTLCPPRKS